jgi:glycosyltransferase involved in cell wall biosynthesis
MGNQISYSDPNEMRKLRILIINYEYPPVGGGGGYICRNVVEGLADLGHEITVVTTGFKELPDYEIKNKVEIYRVAVLMRNKQDTATLPSMLSFVPASILKVNRLLKTRKFDLINTHFAIPSGPAGQFLSKRIRLPNVLTIYGGDIYDPTKNLSPHKTFGLKQTVRKMLNDADGVISDSQDIKERSRNYYGITRNINVIPPAIQPYNGEAKTRKELGLPRDDLILVTLGRLVERKNNKELLDIFKNLQKDVPCHLLIMGDGPDRFNLEKKIDKYDLKDRVTLTGRVEEEKFQYLLASDIYVSAATHEGFGLVFLEAMEMGLPVICYNNGGQVDFLQNGKTGFLVNLGEVDVFKNRLLNLLSKPKMRERMSKYNKELIKQFYIGNCAEKYLVVYREAINNFNRY